MYEYIARRTYVTHLALDACGTCSMLPKDKGGVVDPRLKVPCYLRNLSRWVLTPV